MGNYTSPPGSTGSLPDIAVPDFASIASATTAGQQAAGWFDSFIKAIFEHFTPGLSLVLGFMVSIMDSLLAQFMPLFTGGQGTGWGGTYTLIAAALSDLLGIEVNSSMVQQSFSQGARGANVGALGQVFLSTLQNELTGGVQGQLPASPNPAYEWLGYGMEFAIREGNVEFITSLIPEEFRIGEGLRAYGVMLAESLGLGRLTRQALTSFVKTLISDPMQNYLNNLYRPTLLPVASIIRANMRGGMDSDTMNVYLGYLGYKPADIPQLILDSSTVMSETAAIAMSRTGFYTADQLNSVLMEHGVPQAGLTDFINATIAQRAETHLNATVAAFLQLYKNRWIEHDDLISQLQNLGLSSTEITYALGEVAPWLEYRQAMLSSSEIEDAFLQGLLAITDYATWLEQKGYTPADSQTLQYLLLLKQNKETSAATLAQWRLVIACLNAKAKGQPPPPGLDSNCNPT